MSAKNIFTVYRKELRDLLRDRRTLMSMILIPTLLMPGLTLTTVFVVKNVITKARATAPLVMMIGGEHSPNVRAALTEGGRIHMVPAAADWKQRIVEKRVRAAIELPDRFDEMIEHGEPAKVTIYDYEGEVRSGIAVSELRNRFSTYRDHVIDARLEHHGLTRAVVTPFEVKTENIAPPEKVGGNMFGGMIPYFFLLLSFTGAMYPAMDLTAGEKERGTLETILCSPVARVDLVLGKFLMVLTASLATVACSLASTIGTLLVIGAGWGARAATAVAATAGPFGGAIPSIDPLGMLAVVGMVIPMAVLFSAVQFTLALFAKSFKEAQSYVSPLIIVIILPAVIGMLPGVELNARLALVPILNVSLVSKELVSGVWHWNYIVLIFGSTCIYAVGALALAVRMFNREDVLFRT